MRRKKLVLAFLAFLLTNQKDLQAIELNEKISLSGNISLVHQWLEKERGDFKEKDRGAGVVDATLSVKLTPNDEFAIRVGWAKENGINKYSPFYLKPLAMDLRDDLHNINGRSRDHIKELWYAKSLNISANSTLKMTLGIIDATAFIDENRFANDEYTQFMNEVFVNNPLANLISYDYGVALEWEKNPFTLKLIGMQSKTEEERKLYNYVGIELGTKWENLLGEGNLRVYGYRTNKKFPNWDSDFPKRKALKGLGISFDHDLVKDRLGIFTRLGFQDDKAQVDYKSMYSLGINSNVCLYNKKITLGVGYGFLKAPSKHPELKNTRVYEGYIALPLYEKGGFSSVLTFDWQYMRDKLKEEVDRKGNIWGVRFNLGF